MKTKEIIGYKLKDEKYIEPVKHITGVLRSTMSRKFDEYGYHISNNVAAEDLKEFKVLDIWFEPVYKEEPELEVGRWYKDLDIANPDLFYVTRIEGEKAFIYGFEDGEWKNEGDWYHVDFLISDCAPATDAEVEKALIQEATKRGFKEGVLIKGDFAGNGIEDQEIAHTDEFNFYRHQNCFGIVGGSERGYFLVLFEKGQWAEIISQPKEENIVIFPKSMEGKLTIKYQ